MKNGISTAKAVKINFQAFACSQKNSLSSLCRSLSTRVLFLSMLFNFQGPCRRLTVRIILSQVASFVKNKFWRFAVRCLTVFRPTALIVYHLPAEMSTAFSDFFRGKSRFVNIVRFVVSKDGDLAESPRQYPQNTRMRSDWPHGSLPATWSQ